jgi:xanthine dehydrogenase molybdenum-binding subunit
MAAAAADLFGVPLEELEVGDGLVRSTKSVEREITYDRLVRKLHFRNGGDQLVAEVFYDPPSVHQDKNFEGNVSATYGFATHAAEVEVDIETGKIRVVKMVCAHDVGKALNPIALVGQVEGGVVQGLGYTLTEELIVEEGKVKNPSFVDYHLLRSTDVPPIEVELIETEDPDGPFGAKGMGESPIIPVAAAVANAVSDALGLRLREIPMTCERVLAALGHAVCKE